MNQQSRIPRRAWQRRNVRRNKFASGGTTVFTSNKHSTEQIQRAAKRDWQSSFTPGFEPKSTGDYFECRHTPQHSLAVISDKRQESGAAFSGQSSAIEQEVEPGLDSNFYGDSGHNSALSSADEDPDETATFYDDLLEDFRNDRPTLANHGENTENIKLAEEKKWNE
jgi:hypothetical protein